MTEPSDLTLQTAADDVAAYVAHGGKDAMPAERKAMRRLVTLVEAIEDDPAAFWAMLTPAQALALLKAAPKVAGPWAPLASDRRFTHRPSACVKVSNSSTYTKEIGDGGWDYGVMDACAGDTVVDLKGEGRAEAQRRADELARRKGWVLVE